MKTGISLIFHRIAILASVAAALLLYSVNFSGEFMRGSVWFLGDMGNFSLWLSSGYRGIGVGRHWVTGITGEQYAMLHSGIHITCCMTALLLAVWLLRQIPARCKLTAGWKRAVEAMSLLLLGFLGSYGYLINHLSHCYSVEMAMAGIWKHLHPLACAAVVFLLALLWDLLVPRVQKAARGRQATAQV